MSFESSGDLPLLPPESIFQQVMEAVPERCQDCGVQCQLAAQLAHSLLMKHLLTHVAEDLVGQSGEEFNAMIDTYAPAEIAASLKQITRETTATNLDEIDTAIDATKQEMLDNSKACVAPLRCVPAKGRQRIP